MNKIMGGSFQKEQLFDSLCKINDLILLYKKLREVKLLSMALTHLVQIHKMLFKKTLGTKDFTSEQAKEFVAKYISICAPRQLQSFIDTAQIWENHQSATTKFSRKGALVVCDNDFVMHALTIKDVELWCMHTKKVATTLFEAQNND